MCFNDLKIKFKTYYGIRSEYISKLYLLSSQILSNDLNDSNNINEQTWKPLRAELIQIITPLLSNVKYLYH